MARLAKFIEINFIFGNLAILVTPERNCRSMALRPRFSTGLLLSELIGHIIASCIKFTLFISVILTYKFATSGSRPLRLLQDLLKDVFET